MVWNMKELFGLGSVAGGRDEERKRRGERDEERKRRGEKETEGDYAEVEVSRSQENRASVIVPGQEISSLKEILV